LFIQRVMIRVIKGGSVMKIKINKDQSMVLIELLKSQLEYNITIFERDIINILIIKIEKNNSKR